MLSQRDLDFSLERKARESIKLLINTIRNSVFNDESLREPRIVDMTKSLAKDLGLQNKLIIWSELRLTNNKKYPTPPNSYATLDSLAAIDNLIAEAGVQLKVQQQATEGNPPE